MPLLGKSSIRNAELLISFLCEVVYIYSQLRRLPKLLGRLQEGLVICIFTQDWYELGTIQNQRSKRENAS